MKTPKFKKGDTVRLTDEKGNRLYRIVQEPKYGSMTKQYFYMVREISTRLIVSTFRTSERSLKKA